MVSRSIAFNLISLALLGAPLTASAQELTGHAMPTVVRTAELRDEDDTSYRNRRRPIFEMNVGAGILTRGVTGTLPGHGHDVQGTPTLSADLRLLVHAFDCGSCGFHHGPALSFTYAPGPDFGTTDRYAWRHYVVDAAYAMRMEFPCMRRPGRRVFFTALGGIAGAWADAGTGSTDDPTRSNELKSLAESGDHLALGWRLGATLDLHLRRFLVGVGVDFRQLYGVDTDHAQTTMLGANIRIGFDVPLGATAQTQQQAY